MKKFLIAACAGAASLGLVACGDSADETATTDDVMVTDTAPMAETMPESETVIQSPVAEPTEDLDGDGDIDADDRVSISEDGIRADINDGGTSVTADIDENPGVTVRD